MELSENEISCVRDVVSLFREQGHLLLSGSAKLVLTPDILQLLIFALSKVQEVDFESSFEATPSQPLATDVQCCYDFVQKLTTLKLCTPSLQPPAVLPSSLTLTHFRSLQYLELKRLLTVDTAVKGLSRLRLKLQTLILDKCPLESLQCLLEACLADSSPAVVWSELVILRLHGCRLSILDNSLRLVPWVKLLDLSHNELTETSSYLQNFCELEYLNLSSNKLNQVPELVSNHLHTLQIRYNELTHITGIERLSSLQGLDISFNLISNEAALEPLGYLKKLTQLYLAGNPICYQKNYRRLVAQFIPSNAGRRISLDGKRLSKKEQKLCCPTPIPVYTPPASSIEESMRSEFEVSYSETDSVRTDTRKRRRKKRKVKIEERSSAGEVTDTGSVDSRPRPAPPQWNLHQHSAEEEERRQLRSSIIEKIILQVPTRDITTDETGGRTERKEAPTPPPSPQRVPATCPGEGDAGGEGTEDIAGGGRTIGSQEEQLESKQGQQCDEHSKNSESRQTEAAACDTCTPPPAMSNTLNVLWSSHEQQPNEPTEPTYGDETEPFIVSLKDRPNDNILLSITDRFLVERDIISGGTLNTVNHTPLQSIVTQKLVMGSDTQLPGESQEEAEAGRVAYCISLKMGVHGQRGRAYIVETEDEAKEIRNLLKSFLATNQEEKSVDQLQCLKCDAQFTKSDAKRKVRKVSLTESENVALREKGDLEEYFVCPFCTTDMIVHVTEKKTREPSPDLKFGSWIGKVPMAQSSPFKPQQKFDTESEVQPDPDMPNLTEVPSGDYTSISQVIRAAEFQRKKSLKVEAENIKTSSDTDDEILVLPALTKETTATAAALSTTDSGSLSSTVDPQTLSDGLSQASFKTAQSDLSNSTLQGDPSSITISSNTSAYGSVSSTSSQSASTAVTMATTAYTVSTSQTTPFMMVSVATGLQTASRLAAGNTLATSAGTHGNQLLGAGPFLQEVTMAGAAMRIPPAKISTGQLESQGAGSNRQKEAAMTEAGEAYRARRQSSEISIISDEFANNQSILSQDAFNKDNTTIFEQKAYQHGTAVERPWSHCSECVRYDFSDFSNLDHRLKLHLTMNLLQEEEELRLLLRTTLLQYEKDRSYLGLVAFTDVNFYILKVKQEERITNFTKWLKQVHCEPVIDIQYVEVGLAHQTIRIDSQLTSVTCLLMDERRTKAFAAQLTALLQQSSFSTNSKLEGIGKSSPQVMECLQERVLKYQSSTGTAPIQWEAPDTAVLKYVLCKQGMTSKTPSTHGLVLSPTHLWLADVDLTASAVKTRSASEADKDMFTFKDRQALTDLAEIKFSESKYLLQLYFNDSEGNQKCVWEVTMETLFTAADFIETVDAEWTKTFCVSLDVEWS